MAWEFPGKTSRNCSSHFAGAPDAREIRGTGPDLSIAKKAVDILSGTIPFESKEGE